MRRRCRDRRPIVSGLPGEARSKEVWKVEEEKMAWEIRVTLQDRPGTLAGMSEALGKAGVNIETLASFGAGGQFSVRAVVDDAELARKALDEAGITPEAVKEALLVTLDDRPGALGAFARKLADAGINIESSYVAGDEAGTKRLVFTVDDLEKAKGLL